MAFFPHRCEIIKDVKIKWNADESALSKIVNVVLRKKEFDDYIMSENEVAIS